MLRLVNNEGLGVALDKMKDGDVAVIVSWQVDEYLGQLVQRYDDCLVCLGARSGKGWGKMFPGEHNGLRVRILEEGETIIVGR